MDNPGPLLAVVLVIGGLVALGVVLRVTEREKDRRLALTALALETRRDTAIAWAATVNRPQLPSVTHYSPHAQYQIQQAARRARHAAERARGVAA